MKYNKDELVLGLDIGITSVGWSLIDDKSNELVEFGVRKFEEATPAQDARINRSSRRNNRRKSWRKEQLKDAFVDFGIFSKNIYSDDFLTFTKEYEGVMIRDNTIYHTRYRGLSEMLTKRELFLSLYNIVKTRGHFLIEEVDFLGDATITKEDLYKRLQDIIEVHVILQENKLEEFKDDIIDRLITGKIPSREITKLLKKGYTDIEEDSEADKKLEAIIKILSGYQANMDVLDEKYVKTNITSLKSNDELDDFQNEIINIYDLIQTKKILSDNNYLCEKHIKLLDKLNSYGEITEEKLANNEELADFYKEEKKKMSKEKSLSTLKVVKNVENNYPNGLYLKEAQDLLLNQQTYPEYKNIITDDFIEVVLEIIKARIPYYIGPLSDKGTNSWIVRKEGKAKYSYDYSRKLNLFDEETSIKKWKENMISRCTYLPQEFALPKQSFIIELFTILNDMNIYTVNNNDDTYSLSKEDKINLINNVFLKKEDGVKFVDISDYLDVDSFGSVNNKNIRKFNKTFSLYFKIIKVLPDLEIQNITKEINEYINGKGKIFELEEIIQNLVIYDDFLNKRNIFMRTYSEEQAKALAKLNTKDFSSLSAKFILKTPVDEYGNTIIEKLIETNDEQMTIISNAKDLDGKPKNLSANKYLEKLKASNKLNIDLLIDEGKPIVPMARPVIRGINETFKIFNQVIKEYEVPKRVVIETARDLKDFSEKKQVPAKHFDTMKKLYEDLIKQNKENKINSSSLESWEEISKNLLANKKKIELYIRQDGKDIITGEKINLNELYKYQVDHILPRGFGDNSMDNSILILGSINNKKDNRLPIEFLTAERPDIINEYINRVNSLFDRKMISEKKKTMLLMKNQGEALGFIERNLVDTRYIIKEFRSILDAYTKYNNLDIDIRCLQGSYNNLYREALGIRKDREVGDQHHAHDAAIITIVDKCLEKFAPGYSKGVGFGVEKYNKKLSEITVKEKRSKNIAFIKGLYNYTYGDSPLIEQIKDRTPLLSWKSNKNNTSKFFDATLLSPNENIDKKDLEAYAKDIKYTFKGENYQEELIDEVGKDEFYKNINKYKKNTLKILGVNNELRGFTSVYCFAVDFYKKTLPNGKKKHFAVHIPYVIIKNGEIDKNQYLKLIKEHYGYDELIDEDGDLITGCFKIRLLKNDIYYDTIRNVPHLFNVGSIENRKLEIKRLNIYSYNQVYDIVSDLIEKDNSEESYWKIDQVNNYFENIIQIYEEDGYKIQDLFEIITKYANDELKSKEKVLKYNLFSLFAKGILDAQNPMNAKKIYGQNIITVNNITKQDKIGNGQYVKLVSSPLGMRFTQENDKLKVLGKHKKIKNDEFSWKL